MKSVKTKVLSLAFTLTTLSSVTAVAENRAHYEDDNGILYCEIKCSSRSADHKNGMYPTDSVGEKIKVEGRWVATGFFITTSGVYEVSKDRYTAAESICATSRKELLGLPKIRSLLDTGDVSGVSEKNCSIRPRITSPVGVLTFKMVLETEKDDL